MKRALLVAMIFATAVSIPAQDTFLPMRPDEIETILQLLDAVDAAQIVVLESPQDVTESNLEDLRQLVRVAETIGAADLAARARTLIMLAAFGQSEPPPTLPPVEGGVELTPDTPFARDTEAFRRWVNVGATSGATALGMATVFYYLAERNYQSWLDETDPDLSTQLYRAWQGYDYLGLGLGAATLLSVGVAMPLVFALTPPATTLATPPAVSTFTPAGRQAELDRLYAARLDVVEKLNRLNEHEKRRTLTTTISVGTGAVGAIVAGTFAYLASEKYDLYLEAQNQADAEALGKLVSLFDGITAFGAGLGGAGFGLAATVSLVTPNRAQLERELERLNASIIRVRASRTIDAPDPQPEEELSRRERRAAERAARKAAAAEEAAAAEATTPDTETAPDTGSGE